VTARGNERRAIFRDDQDRRHFLELLAELPERFGTRLHGWVLMENHFHLLMETPEPNLSQTGQWLNVSYSVGFNRRHQRSGHLFQGRFGAVLVGGLGDWLEVARYVHLNPVRVARLGLSKQDRQRQKTAAGRDPGAKLVAERVRVLRNYRWSSYRAYVGLVTSPDWLTQEALLGASGGRNAGEQRKAFEQYHQAPLREGRLERVWDRVVSGAVLGSERFVAEVKAGWKRRSSEEVRSGEFSGGGVSWKSIVQAVEAVHGGRWEEFRDCYGDWGRDAALYLGRQRGRVKLQELAEVSGGVGYTAVAQAIRRVRQQIPRDKAWRDRIDAVSKQLSTMKM
jgi:REP element-mobilizing transposase RayT